MVVVTSKSLEDRSWSLVVYGKSMEERAYVVTVRVWKRGRCYSKSMGQGRHVEKYDYMVKSYDFA